MELQKALTKQLEEALADNNHELVAVLRACLHLVTTIGGYAK